MPFSSVCSDCLYYPVFPRRRQAKPAKIRHFLPRGRANYPCSETQIIFCCKNNINLTEPLLCFGCK